jgi:DNA-directed RNA polymerase specialized sigma subunit
MSTKNKYAIVSQNKALDWANEFIREAGILDEDLQQEIYLRSLEMIGTYYNKQRFMNCLINHSKRYYKKRIEKLNNVTPISKYEISVDHFANLLKNENDRIFVRESLSVLNERELYIISQYFVFEGEPRVLSDIARELNISSTRVGRIKHRAILKMKYRCMRLKKAM